MSSEPLETHILETHIQEHVKELKIRELKKRVPKNHNRHLYGLVLERWQVKPADVQKATDIFAAPDLPPPPSIREYLMDAIHQARQNVCHWEVVAVILGYEYYCDLITDDQFYRGYDFERPSICGAELRQSHSHYSWLLMEDGTTEEI